MERMHGKGYVTSYTAGANAHLLSSSAGAGERRGMGCEERPVCLRLMTLSWPLFLLPAATLSSLKKRIVTGRRVEAGTFLSFSNRSWRFVA